MPVIPALRKSRVQGQHPQHREFEANLGYMTACIKTKQTPSPQRGWVIVPLGEQGGAGSGSVQRSSLLTPAPRSLKTAIALVTPVILPRQRKVKWPSSGLGRPRGDLGLGNVEQQSALFSGL